MAEMMLSKGNTCGLGDPSSDNTEISPSLCRLRTEIMAYIGNVKEELTANLQASLCTNLQEISEIADLVDMQALKAIGATLDNGVSLCEGRFFAIESNMKDLEQTVSIKADQSD